jgi:hypothetical protein
VNLQNKQQTTNNDDDNDNHGENRGLLMPLSSDEETEDEDENENEQKNDEHTKYNDNVIDKHGKELEIWNVETKKLKYITDNIKQIGFNENHNDDR